MYTSTYDVLLVVALDLVLFLLLFLAFALYRKLRSKPINVSSEISVMRPYMDEAEHTGYDIGKKVLSMDLDEIYTEMGEWAYMYLSLHRFILISVICLSIPSTGLLLIYYYGNNENSSDSIHITSISHVINDPDLLMISVFFMIFYSIIIYGFGLKFLFKMIHSRNDSHLFTSQDTVVMIRGLPKKYNSEYITEIIKNCIGQHFKLSIRLVYTVPYLIIPYKHFLKQKNNEKKIKLLNHDLELSGEPTYIKKKCKKVDGLAYYEKKRFWNLTKVHETRKKFKELNAGVAFVVFNNSISASNFLKAGFDYGDKLNAGKWEIMIAPVAHDILWENVGIDRVYAMLVKVFLNLLFILIFLVIITPSAFEQQLQIYLDYTGLTQLVVGTLAISLPSLVLVIYQLVILPPVVTFMVKTEKHMKKHTRVTSSLKKYFFFLIFYTLIFPILGLQFLDVIKLFFDGDWQFELGTKVGYTGELFFVFMIHQAFIKNGFDLLVASKYLLAMLKVIFLAKSHTEKKLCFEAEPFEFDFELAVSLNAFAITCGLSIIYPIIMIPALLFFSIRVITT